jgi:hypothetical protein
MPSTYDVAPVCRSRSARNSIRRSISVSGSKDAGTPSSAMINSCR